MFAIKRTKNGDIECRISFNLINLGLRSLGRLDRLISHKLFYLMSMGLGIGFGISVVIFSRPIPTYAGNSGVSQLLIPEQVISSSHNLSLTVATQPTFTLIAGQWKKPAVYFDHWSNRPEQIAVGIASDLLPQWQLGDKIQILAANQGLYTYTIYHLKQVKSQDILQLRHEPDAQLIIISPENWLGTTNWVALAK